MQENTSLLKTEKKKFLFVSFAIKYKFEKKKIKEFKNSWTPKKCFISLDNQEKNRKIPLKTR